jgi:hypothetical protein
MNRIRVRTLALACCLAACVTPRTAAEVGIATTESLSVPYILAQITDDSDPWGGAWKRFSFSTSRTVLNPDGFTNGDGLPSLQVLPDGRVLVAWARNSATGFDVVASVYASSAWSQPLVISAALEDELDPSVAVEPDGTVHLVYTVLGAESEIVHRTAPADLSSWSAETRVSLPGELARKPSAAWDGQQLRVAYEIADFGVGQTPRSIAVARQEGTSFLAEVVGVSYFEGELSPRVHQHAGTVWVDWADAEHEVAWTRVDTLGQWEPLEYEPYTTPSHQEFHVRPGLRLTATTMP